MNAEKIKEPIHPFYLYIPMTEVIENEDGTTTAQTVPVVSVYPKNEPVVPPEEPPILPPTPDTVTGQFQIVKHDKQDPSILLEGAKVKVYRAATTEDTTTEMVQCNGIQYAVVPVIVNGEELIMTTNENGFASSPELSCGTYFLVEIEAPPGYHLSAEAFQVSVNSSVMTTISTVQIPNQRGSILPETGGTGTAMFTMTGVLLITLAGMALIVSRRRAN